MNIVDMHKWVRQYAQQMGAQNNRTLLPEQIDILINTAIIDSVNQLITENIVLTSTQETTNNSKLGQINALKPLYKVAIIDMSPKITSRNSLVFVFDKNDRINGKMTTNFPGFVSSSIPDYLYLVGFSINYKQVIDNLGYTGYTSTGQGNNVYLQPKFKEGTETKFFPVRIIDDTLAVNTMNDYVLKNKITSPIIVAHDNHFDLYIDTFIEKSIEETSRFLLKGELIPYKLRMSYIAKPAKVKYVDIDSTKNVNCDLPEYMHTDILKRAVDLYRITVSGSLHSSQQASNTDNNVK